MSENNDNFKCVNCEKRFPSEKKLKEHYIIEENLQKENLFMVIGKIQNKENVEENMSTSKIDSKLYF